MIDVQAMSRILAKIQAFDHRNVASADVLVWTEAVQLADPPIEEADALAAVTRWFASRGEGWLRPAHLIEGAHQVAALRRQLQREQARQDAIEGAPTPSVRDRGDRVKALVADLRSRLGRGNPAVMRRAEWLQAEQRRDRAEHRALSIGGTGFCVPCYRHGQITVASDPVAGSTCETCEREGKGGEA